LLPLVDKAEDDTPVGDGAKEHEDVPDGVEARFAVVGKEIGACGIENALGYEETDGKPRETRHDGFDNEQNAPTHDKIDGKGEFREFTHGENLVESATENCCPLESEDSPAYPATYDTNADGSVGAGYHDVDADMVELAQHVLCHSGVYPVVDGAAEKHEEHADDKENNAKCHLPAFMHGRPHHPDAR